MYDVYQLEEQGISRDNLHTQMECFRKGFSPLLIDRPARTGEGILQITESMAHWNTILVEVPNAIFHPVKSIWDLLTSDHQSI